MEHLGAISNWKQWDLALSADVGAFVRVDGQNCRTVNTGPSEDKAGHYFHAAYQIWKLHVLKIHKPISQVIHKID